MKKTVALPRLRTKEELLKSNPELQKLFGIEQEEDKLDAVPSKPQAGRPPPGGNYRKQPSLQTPRDGEEEMTEEEVLRRELEKVKTEREKLTSSIANSRAQAGTAGGEAQQNDIKSLRKELEMKKSKLNELQVEIKRKEKLIARLKDDNRDASRMTPEELADEQNYIQQLKDELKLIDEDLTEADAKNRLYYLLGERTRREHQATDQKLRAAQQLKKDCRDDLNTLLAHMNDMKAAKEFAERDLAKTRKMLEETRSDWNRKLKERRREVNELKKRQQIQQERERKLREKVAEKDKVEREAALKVKIEQDAYEQKVAQLAPKVDAMESSWNRIRTVSGAESAEEVIQYWDGLKSKEGQMRDLVRLAEEREAAAKAEIARLLEGRAQMYERQQKKEMDRREEEAAAEAAAEAAQESEVSPEEAQKRISEAHHRAADIRAKFSKLRAVTISAEMGIKSLVDRLMLALGEITPESLRSTHLAVTQTRAGRVSPAVGGGRVGSKLYTPDKKTRATVATPPKGGPRVSSPSMSQHHPDRPGSVGKSHEPSGVDESLFPPTIAEGGSNTIDDDQFFPQVPQLLVGLSDRLDRVLAFIDAEPMSASRAAPVSAPAVESQAESAAGDKEGGEEGEEGEEEGAGGEGDAAPADAPAAPEAPLAVEPLSLRLPDVHADQTSAADAPMSPTEKRLTKGLDPKPWGSSPFLSSVRDPLVTTLSGMPTMKKRKGKKRDAVKPPALERILGYCGEDGADDDDEEEEEEEELGDDADKDDGVIDRDAIKLRATKILARAQAQAQREKAAAK